MFLIVINNEKIVNSNKYIPINNHPKQNINGLHALTKRHRVAECIKNNTHLHAAYQSLTSDLNTHTDWKDGDRYTKQTEK